MYSPYLSYDEYLEMGGNTLPPEEATRALREASRHIDTLTYNRILKYGFNNLTPFQVEIIKECVFELSDFEYENAEYLNGILSNYSINGVSMKLSGNSSDGNFNVNVRNGIVINPSLYAKLEQTGLCTASFRV